MEEDSAMLLLELVHAATPGSSNCYCWSTCVSRACTSHAEINSRKKQAKKQLDFLGRKGSSHCWILWCGLLWSFTWFLGLISGFMVAIMWLVFGDGI
jgi:hypothetical protein